MEKLSTWMLESNNMAIAAASLLGVVAAMYIVYNSLSYAILKEKYHGIRFTTKNIAYITMFTAVSVSVTVVISLTLPITVFPPIRVAFEGVMIKITGLIFGPIVGIIVGLTTEILVMLFVPSFIHPAFTICAIAYGFVAGVGSSFMRAGKGKEWIMLMLITIFMLAFGGFMFYIIGEQKTDTIPILSFEVSVTIYKWMFVAIMIAILIGIYLFVFFLTITKRYKVLHQILPILLIVVVAEFLVTTVISAWGDGEFLGIATEDNGGYQGMVVARLVQTPIKIIFNTGILYFVYKTVSPLIKRDR